MKPFPTIEQAYAHVCREALRQNVMTVNTDTFPRAVLASRGMKLGLGSRKQSDFTKSKGVGVGVGVGERCSYYGNYKHTHESCFKLNGYPMWWLELQGKKKNDGDGTDKRMGKAVVVIVESDLSLIPQIESSQDENTASNISNTGSVFISNPSNKNNDAWLLDSGATDHMTYDANDFTWTSLPRRTSMANANGLFPQLQGLALYLYLLPYT